MKTEPTNDTDQAAKQPAQKLTTTIASKVLNADLANILKKAASGKPLTKYERELIATSASPEETPAEIPAGRPSDYSHPEKHYAELYKCDVRTVRNWKKENAPLDYPEKMPAWLANRKNVPPGTLTPDQATADPDAVQEFQPIELHLDQKEGAAAALTRLAQAELNASENYARAIRGGNPLNIKNTLNAWLETSEALRRYDSQIEAGRRDSGELLPRTEIERIFRAVAFFLRIAGQQSIEAACDTTEPIWQIKEPWEMNKLLSRLLWETLMNTFAALGSHADGVEMSVPRWAIQALSSDLDFVLKDAPEIVQKRAEAIRVLIQYNAKETGKAATKRKK